MKEPQNQVLDHEYDGIREYDNPTPGWWHAILVITIVFSLLYWSFFTFSPAAWTPQDVHARAELAGLRKQFAEIGTLAMDEATVMKMMNDPKWLSVGAATFKGNCTSCHGARAEGQVGPNLTDDHWKNVKTVAEIAKVVASGAANGAMPAWAGRLHQNEVVLVSAYVASLRGRNEVGRGPEGDKINPWAAGVPVVK
jgi:cytochrome c oxidase cbb3-type subunit III